jgi:hypothetical protein
VAATRAAWAADHAGGPAPPLCGPTDDDVALMRTLADECVTTRNATSHTSCQIISFRLCTAWAKLLGDGYHVLLDVDEYLWAPPQPHCWAGGCPLNDTAAPLTTPGAATLLDGLRAYLDGPVGRLHAQVSVWGGMFGPSGYLHANWSDPGAGAGAGAGTAAGGVPLVTDTHVWSTAYDRGGYATPAVGCATARECREQLTNAYPQKSAVAVRAHPALPIAGIAIHTHGVGTQRIVDHHAGELLRYNHYSFLSVEETYLKKVVRNRNPPYSAPAQIVDDRNGAREYFSAQYSPAAADFAPLLRSCMAQPTDAQGRFRPACGVPLPDWRDVDRPDRGP